LEVAEAIGLSLQDFHFGVEAFRDAVIPGEAEAPHSCDFIPPGVKCFAQLYERREPGVAKFPYHSEETWGQPPEDSSKKRGLL